jgi:hypothetical protein
MAPWIATMIAWMILKRSPQGCAAVDFRMSILTKMEPLTALISVLKMLARSFLEFVDAVNQKKTRTVMEQWIARTGALTIL